MLSLMQTLVAISKVMWAVKLHSSKILQFLIGLLDITQMAVRCWCVCVCVHVLIFCLLLNQETVENHKDFGGDG